MQEAKERLEQRARDRAEKERAAYEEKVARRNKRKGKTKGPKIRHPKDTPKGDEQINLTDSDSRLMRKSKRHEYKQGYNGQVAVDADGSQLILSSHITNCASDSNELLASVKSVSKVLKKPKAVLADSGYVNQDAFKTLEENRIEAYVAVSSDESHSQRTYEFRPVYNPSKKVVKNPRLRKMQKKLRTEEGRKIYAKRKHTVEPVFGIIKHVLGFRRFFMRGIAKVESEWELVCLAYNLKRLHRLRMG